jgi:branched-chain amino acid transport system substrate-binding protein
MAKRNELPALAASLLITAALLMGGVWWLKGQFNEAGSTSDTGNSAQVASGKAGIAGADGSSGRSMLSEKVSPAKQNGLDALAKGDYATAQTEFTAALKEKRNDPESLIYLNNAKIGNSKAYSIALSVPAGDNLNSALEIMRGVAQAQSDINEAGGIGSRPVKILVVDDSDNKETAAAIATDLVNDKAVLGVVGHYSSDTTLAAAEQYEAGKLTMISPTSTAVKIADAGDYIFRTVPSDRLAAAVLARHVLNEINKKQAVVFYTSKSAYSNSVKTEFTTELLSNGGKVVADFDVSESGFNAARAMKTAQEAGADVIMLALNADSLDTALQVISVNQQALPMVGGDSLYDPKILDIGQANAEGLTVAVPWHILSHEQSPFATESRQLWGGNVSWRTAMAYDAVQVLAAAIKENPTREGVQAALSASGFSAAGATDAVSFFPSGDRNQPSQLVKVVPGSAAGGNYTYEPVPAVGSEVSQWTIIGPLPSQVMSAN